MAKAYILTDNNIFLQAKTDINNLPTDTVKIAIGELCFNTSMTGYQEILTDPSYKNQIISFTFPHIGNVGTNDEDYESQPFLKDHCKTEAVNIENLKAIKYKKGFITRNAITGDSNYRSTEDLKDFAINNNYINVYDCDTRYLTELKKSGEVSNIMLLVTHDDFDIKSNLEILFRYLKEQETMNGMELASQVGVEKSYWYNGKRQEFSDDSRTAKEKKNLAVIDYGIKESMLHILEEKGFNITIFPWNTVFEEIKDYDAFFLSNGPGDPRKTLEKDNAVVKKTIAEIVKSNKPVLAICLGHQMLSMTLNCKVDKMPAGHRGANHPVQNLKNKQVEITSQNHGFCVSEVPNDIEVIYRSLFDNTIEGIKVKEKPIYSVQHHPEASSGPHDSRYIFDEFSKAV